MKSTYQGNFIRKAVLSAFIALIFISLPAVFSASYAFANTEPVASGKLEGDGTHFKLTDSAYLNITLDSSEPVRVSIESVPETVSIHIGPIPDVTFTTLTDITLSGFAPYTTYHKYEDDFHNHEEFVTDADGKYTYVQDITVPHLIFILPRKSTKFINSSNSSGGDCASIGSWNSLTSTCTLTTNVNETIQIDSNITLDGNNYTVQGSGFGNGVYLPSGRNGVTVKNLIVRNFSYGIYLYSSSNNTLTNNTANSNSYGIRLSSSSNNTLTGNTASNNYAYGIYLGDSSNNTLTNNTAQENNYYDVYSDAHCNNTITNTTGSGNRPIKYFNSAVSLYNETLSELILCNADNSSISNITIDGSAAKKNNGLLLIVTDSSTIENVNSSNNNYGIYLLSSNSNTLTNNTASNNSYGILLYGSSGNTLTGNTASNNNYGIYLSFSGNNTLTGNTASSNIYGIYLYSSNSNTLTDNTASSNIYGIYLYSSNSNTLTGNTASNNSSHGIDLYSSNNNTLTDNTASSNYYGIYLLYSNNNTLTGNTVSNNINRGIYLYSCSSNQIYNNNFISNSTQAYVYGGSGNVFNLAPRTGGNYWSNFDTPAEGCSNTNGDNFCDAPYSFIGGQDNLPWTTQNGWLDSTPPTTTDNAPSGWQNADFTVTLTCTDDASGCKETKYSIDGGSWQTGNSIPISTEGDHEIGYYSVDNDGNTESANHTYARLDKTPPTISGSRTPSANAYGWNNTDVTVSFVCSDALSGIASCTPPQTIETEIVALSLTGIAIDLAGNTANTTVGPINIDKTPPVITINIPVSGGGYILNEIVIADWSATDALSGVASSTGTVLSGAAINTASVGAKNFSATANDYAGNTAAQAITYYVLYAYSGILQPINADGSSIFKLGSTIPVKFQLMDANGNYVSSAIARIYLAKISSGILGLEIEATSTSSATTGNLFRYDATNNQYIFNLGTKGLTTGTWQIRISLDDGSSYSVNISLK